LACFGSQSVQAQTLSFGTPVSEPSKILINQYLGADQDRFDIAPADLNEDGLYEFILKSRACSEDGVCLYKILATSDGGPVEVSVIKAVRLELGQGYTYGIRNLVAHSNPDNDFARDIYAWDSAASRYKISE
jgi:hypothetical protein